MPRPAGERLTVRSICVNRSKSPAQKLRGAAHADAGILCSARILDLNLRLVASCAGPRKRDLAAGVGELGGVVEKVREHLREPDPVAVHDDIRARQGHRQSHLRLIEVRPAHLDGRLHDARQADRFDVEAQLAARHARHVEQIVDEADELADLPLDDLPGLVERRRIVGPEPHDLEGVADGSQRIAELVGQRRHRNSSLRESAFLRASFAWASSRVRSATLRSSSTLWRFCWRT